MLNIKSEVFRFLLVGGVNTLISYIFYLGLVYFFSYVIAYTISFIITIFISYSLNTFFVFKSNWEWKKLLRFPVVYAVQYVVSVVLLAFFVEKLNVPEKYAPIGVVILVIPVTFVMSRYIIRGKEQ